MLVAPAPAFASALALALALALSLSLLPAPLGAQGVPAADSSRARLDTVTVAARHESRSLAQVPFAVSVVSAASWRGGAGIGMDRALQQVPGQGRVVRSFCYSCTRNVLAEIG